jgi:uncharacterized protein (DUF1501 family)
MLKSLLDFVCSFQENLSTLNYASLAKRIANTASVNEDPKARLIRRLRAQVLDLVIITKMVHAMSENGLKSLILIRLFGSHDCNHVRCAFSNNSWRAPRKSWFSTTLHHNQVRNLHVTFSHL